VAPVDDAALSGRFGERGTGFFDARPPSASTPLSAAFVFVRANGVSFRHWGEEVVAYADATGDTHLLSGSLAAIFLGLPSLTDSSVQPIESGDPQWSELTQLVALRLAEAEDPHA
jgi:hypothetical protein